MDLFDLVELLVSSKDVGHNLKTRVVEPQLPQIQHTDRKLQRWTSRKHALKCVVNELQAWNSQVALVQGDANLVWCQLLALTHEALVHPVHWRCREELEERVHVAAGHFQGWILPAAHVEVDDWEALVFDYPEPVDWFLLDADVPPGSKCARRDVRLELALKHWELVQTT